MYRIAGALTRLAPATERGSRLWWRDGFTAPRGTLRRGGEVRHGCGRSAARTLAACRPCAGRARWRRRDTERRRPVRDAIPVTAADSPGPGGRRRLHVGARPSIGAYLTGGGAGFHYCRPARPLAHPRAGDPIVLDAPERVRRQVTPGQTPSATPNEKRRSPQGFQRFPVSGGDETRPRDPFHAIDRSGPAEKLVALWRHESYLNRALMVRRCGQPRANVGNGGSKGGNGRNPSGCCTVRDDVRQGPPFGRSECGRGGIPLRAWRSACSPLPRPHCSLRHHW